MSINWYMSLYYKYRDYPVHQINSKYKGNQLKSVYSNVFSGLSSFFYIDALNQQEYVNQGGGKNPSISNKKTSQKLNSSTFSNMSTYGKIFDSSLHITKFKNNSGANSGSKQNLLHQFTDKSIKEDNLKKSQFNKRTLTQQQQQDLETKELFKLVINTNKESIFSLLIQEINQEKQSNYQIVASSNQQLSRTCKNESQNNSIPSYCAQDIVIQTIPTTNQEINYYFLQFCSKTDTNDVLIFHRDKYQNKLDDDSFNQSNTQSNLKKIIPSSKNKKNIDPNFEMDALILKILKKQLTFSNEVSSKFYNPQNTSNINSNTWFRGLNIIIQTWIQLIIINQNENVIHQMIKQLVKQGKNPFTEKINSYLHFICLANTKFLFSKAITKHNFLLLLPQFISGTRCLNDFKLQKSEQYIKIYDISLQRYIYNSEAFNLTLQKWKNIGGIISEVLIQNLNIFWGKLFFDCCCLADQFLNQKVELSYSLIVLYQQLQQRLQADSQQLSADKILFYQKAIKIILQRQVGFNKQQINTTKSQIKSKTTVNDCHYFILTQKCNLFPGHAPSKADHFSFYDQKTAHNESKIYQLKQWQKVVKQLIDKLKGYRKILDYALQIFKGNPEYITVFFLQSYFNFKNIQTTPKMDFSKTVSKYCDHINNVIISYNIKSDKKLSYEINQILTQLQIHKQNHQQMSKYIISNFRSKQVTVNRQTLGTFSAGSQDNEKTLINDQQSNLSQIQTANDNAIDALSILEQDYLTLMISKLKNQQHSNKQREQSKMVIKQINRYIKLLNQCNFLFNIIQQTQINSQVDKKAFQSKNDVIKMYTKVKNLAILNTKELSFALAKLNLQHQLQSKSLMMQTHQHHRKTSNPSKNLRMSSMNSNFKGLINKKNSLTYQGLMKQNQNEINCQKFLHVVKSHNQCLELLVNLYYKQCQFQKFLLKNVECQACCLRGEENLEFQNYSKNILLQKNSKNSYKSHNMAAHKMNTYVKKYQEAHKSINNCDLSSLINQLQQQITLNELKTEILHTFMFIASLQVNSSTFLALYKQDLISDQKLSKIKVIGKSYYDFMHQLLTNKNKCGEIFQSKSYQQRNNMYLQNILVIIVSLIQLAYNRTQDSKQLMPYTTLVMSYFVSKTYNTSKNEKNKISDDLINLNSIMLDCFDWNEQNLPNIGLKSLILKLLQLRTMSQNQSVPLKLKQHINKQFRILNKYTNSNQRVEYLQKKILYLMLRQIYFYCYYDIEVFQIKSIQARKNYSMYQRKMMAFFQQIIQKDQKQFLEKKSQQLKQRSTHLKGYLLDYQSQPNINQQQRRCIIKIVCIFDKTLNLLTENKQFQMKKRGANSISVLRKNRKKADPMYLYYVSTQYSKPNGQKVKVFQNEGYYFLKAIQIYEDILSKKIEDSEKKYSIYKQLGFVIPTSICISFQQSDFQIIKQSRQSLLALWINIQYRNLHQYKMVLSRQNFLSKIQKLYIDLDVRHKVFQFFKDRILNYEMQKTKIYHQYMDYIRGLKLDVYSHVTGENPFPYFKLINAIKLYRLNIKKQELDEKVTQEFGKNLGKWNEGIVKDLTQYNNWVFLQNSFWQKMNQGSNQQKRQLFEIYTIVNKQLLRQQNQTIQMALKPKENLTKTKKAVNFRKTMPKLKYQKKLF